MQTPPSMQAPAANRDYNTLNCKMKVRDGVFSPLSSTKFSQMKETENFVF